MRGNLIRASWGIKQIQWGRDPYQRKTIRAHESPGSVQTLLGDHADDPHWADRLMGAASIRLASPSGSGKTQVKLCVAAGFRSVGRYRQVNGRTLLRVVACLLLLLFGGELYACATGVSTTCELAGVPDGPRSAAGDCMCCCLHLYVAPPPVFAPIVCSVPVIAVPEPLATASEPLSIYRPPRA